LSRNLFDFKIQNKCIFEFTISPSFTCAEKITQSCTSEMSMERVTDLTSSQSEITVDLHVYIKGQTYFFDVWKLYTSSGLTFKVSTVCKQSIDMFFSLHVPPKKRPTILYKVNIIMFTSNLEEFEIPQDFPQNRIL
jgi:hypothetical protein